MPHVNWEIERRVLMMSVMSVAIWLKPTEYVQFESAHRTGNRFTVHGSYQCLQTGLNNNGKSRFRSNVHYLANWFNRELLYISA